MKNVKLLQLMLFLIAVIATYLTNTDATIHPTLGGGTGGSGDVDEPHGTQSSYYITVALGA